MAGLGDVLGVIITASLRVDARMLKRWPLVCWAAYRAADRVWPRVVREGLSSPFRDDLMRFNKYIEYGVSEAGLSTDGLCIYVRHCQIQLEIWLQRSYREHTITWHRLSVNTGSQQIMFRVDPYGRPGVVDGRLSPLYRVVMRIFPELSGARV